MYNAVKINDALSLMFRRTGLEEKFDEAKALYTAKKIISVYNAITPYIKKIFLKNKILYISVSSSVAKEDLLYRQTTITTAINTALGKTAIEKIVLL
jgi:predicted site-specific integrase-resolvase